MNTRRPLSLILAPVLIVLFSVFGLITAFGADAPPLPVALFAFIIAGVGGLIAAFGLWLLKRWGLWLSIVIAALAIPVSVPGLVFGQDAADKLLSMGVIAWNILILVLVALPATHKAVPLARAPAAQV